MIPQQRTRDPKRGPSNHIPRICRDFSMPEIEAGGPTFGFVGREEELARLEVSSRSGHRRRGAGGYS